MESILFTGACTALVTPFLNQQVNYPMAEQLLRRQIDANIPAVVLAGTTGESATLSDEEKLELFRRGARLAGGACKIIAGTGSNNTAHAVELSRAAEACGVHALLVVSPYYNKATPSGLVAHYRAIAEAVSLPIIVYNVPSRTGVDIPVSVYKVLSGIPNIIGVKEASTDITKISRIRLACGNGFSIWCGNDDQAAAAIALGAKGVISVLSNVLPEKTQALALSALAGDFDTAGELQSTLLPLTDLLFCEVNPIPVKAALRCMGLDVGGCRLPLTELSASHQTAMERYFQRL